MSLISTSSAQNQGATFPTASILGYPRIGPNRELKRAVEAFWAGKTDTADLERTAKDLRSQTRARLAELGLGKQDASIPETFSFYDQVLDASTAFGVLPARFERLRSADGSIDLAGYFTVARGQGDDLPLEMTKWFDTNYHYLVPELGPDTEFALAGNRYVEQFLEAKEEGFVTRPVLLGPVTYLALAKPAVGVAADFNPLDLLPKLLPVYAELLARLADAGAPWVQIDEPAVVSDNLGLTAEQIGTAITAAYGVLTTEGAHRPQILVTTPYGDVGTLLPTLAALEVEALALDLVLGTTPDFDAVTKANLADKTLVAGLVDGHNIWRTDLSAQLEILESLEFSGVGSVAVTTSTSLQHIPYTLAGEEHLGEELISWLAFAEEKTQEVVTLATGISDGREAIHTELLKSADAIASRTNAAGVNIKEIRERTAALQPSDFDRVDAQIRKDAQTARLNLPDLPTTTIGSFPQTIEIRKARAAHARGELSSADYEEAMKAEIAQVIKLQEEIGLDVLVHGEAERNDMVQYFAELLDGFSVTKNGWVQSYGSRCTRPSILWGDVSRPAPMTVRWTQYAQSLSDLPVKGMLTGPVTIMAWSFVRDDIPLRETANQIGLALRDEVIDLEAAGIAAIQVDEPALRELLPLRKVDHADYLDWSVNSFRLSTAGIRPDTQIHTHLCYSEFGDVIGAIDGLNADVTSIEAARSRMEVLPELASAGFARGVGPGVYDIHSPRVPSQEEVTELLELAVKSVDPDLLWVNPDCGLKTRGYAETTASLKNLVGAALAVRAQV